MSKETKDKALALPKNNSPATLKRDRSDGKITSTYNYKSNSRSVSPQAVEMSSIMLLLKNNQVESAVILANDQFSKDESVFIKLLDKLNSNQIKNITKPSMTQTLRKALICLKQELSVLSVINFLKTSFISLDMETENSLMKSLTEELEILIGKKEKYNISDEDVSDINLIIAVLRNKLSSFNELIEDFKK